MFRAQFWLACLLALSLSFGMIGCSAENGDDAGGNNAAPADDGADDGANQGSGG